MLTYMAYTSPSETEANKELLMGFDVRVVPSGNRHDDQQLPTDLRSVRDRPDVDPAQIRAEFPLPAIGVCGPDVKDVKHGTNCSLKDLSFPNARSYPLWESELSIDSAAGPLSVQAVVTDFEDQAWDYWFRPQSGSKPTDGGIAVNQALLDELERIAQRHEVTADTSRLNLGEGQRSAPILGRMALFTDVEIGRTSFGLVSWSTPTVFIQEGSPWAKQIQQEEPTELLVNGPVVASYQDYGKFTVDGFAVLSGSVLAHPPAFATEDPTYYDFASYTMLFIGGSLALLETVLIAGAAFAVGIRQQQRTLALLSVTGVEPRTLRQVTLFGGLLSGIISTVAGLSLGWVVVRAAIVWGEQHGLATQEPNYLPWLYILTALLVIAAAIVAVLIPARMTARIDAWSAVKGSEVFRARPSRWMIAIGATLSGAGIIVLAVLTGWGLSIPTQGEFERFVWIAVPVMGVTLPLLLVGVVLMIGSVFTFVFRLANRLPVSARLAIREAVRNRSRVIPVTAAILVATTLGTVVLLNLQVEQLISSGERTYGLAVNDAMGGLVSVQDPKQDRYFERKSHDDQIAAYRDGLLSQEEYEDWLDRPEELEETVSLAQQRAKLDQTVAAPGLPPLVSVDQVRRVLPSCTMQNKRGCTNMVPALRLQSPCRIDLDGVAPEHKIQHVWKELHSLPRHTARTCEYGEYGHSQRDEIELVVADPAIVEQVLGRKLTASEQERINRGHAVVFDKEYLNSNGTVTLLEVGEQAPRQDDDDAVDAMDGVFPGSTVLGNPLGEVKKRVTVPAFEPEGLSPEKTYPRLMIPENALVGSEQGTDVTQLSYRFAEPLTQEQVAYINDSLKLQHNYLANPQLNEDPSDMRSAVWLLITLIGLGIITIAVATTALATADARVEARVMTVVGASPSIRRNVAASQTLLAVGLGTVIGVGVGVLPYLMYSILQTQQVGGLPLLQLAALSFGVPLVAAGLSWVFVPRAVSR